MAKQLPLSEMAAMGWTAADTAELNAWKATDAQALGMAPAGLAAMQQAASGATDTPAGKALAAEPGQALSAAAGGLYKSADGALTARSRRASRPGP